MKMFARTVLAGMATLMLAAPAQAQTTYNIASLADFTGPYADVMKDLNGARHSAVAWWNAEVGKDLGVQLKMKDYDHRYDAAQVASLWPGIKAELNPIIALGVGAPDATALQGRLPADGIPLIMSTAGYGFGWKSDPWVFNPRSTYAHEAAAFLEWYRKQNNVSGALKVAVFSSEASPAYVDIAKGLRKYADENKATIDLVEIVYTEVQPTDLTTQVNRVLNKGAQVLDVQTNTAAVVAVKRALQALNKKVPIVMSSHNGITASASAIGGIANLEGDYEVYGMAMPTDENTKSRQFYEKLKSQYGMKGGWTVPTVMGLNQTLVALRAVEAAAKKSGAANVTGRGVREALLSTTITSEQTFEILSDVKYTNDAPFPTTGATVNIGIVKGGKYITAAPGVAVPQIGKW
ncbi:ABC transporter substrate-binding protein [Ferrovibrio sp.]|jgi:branched-chain amino acid transport system substrate-binding protein|uniref:ABC transporter substrate-binding protein n=1 Tax=Ferrovibrio sp. TaxID=1917215 RepID=UPI0025C50DD5|nr:ABC transporter substrate-binding protein [Ferrovibrio sp.]MBX3456573.1 ABC transporter substrate-binding protein [Ferrovibrio sp.]